MCVDCYDLEGELEMNDSVKILLKWMLVGWVVSNKMDKIVIVLIEYCVKYLIYGKYVVCLKKYYVYDEVNIYNEGDFVEIQEMCFVLKMKVWMVLCFVEVVCVI